MKLLVDIGPGLVYFLPPLHGKVSDQPRHGNNFLLCFFLLRNIFICDVSINIEVSFIMLIPFDL